MTDAELAENYSHWRDSELSEHRSACLAMARAQFKYGRPRVAAQCRARAEQYARALELRSVRP